MSVAVASVKGERRFRPYSSYKDSGETWVGKVPSDWDLKPLWTMFRRRKRTGYPDAELLSVYRDYGVIPKASRDDNFNKASEDLSAYQLVELRDLVTNKMKTWQGSIAVSTQVGIVSPAYHVYTPLHSQVDRYIHHLLRSPAYVSGYLQMSKGIRVNQWDLEPEAFSRMQVLLPPIAEQRAIAEFLDRETGKIDALVANKERLIELLQEKRTALITHAVTKGLDPSAPTKPSGIDWLGDIPAHWEAIRLGRKIQLQRGVDITKDEQHEGSIPVVSSGGVASFHDVAYAQGPGVIVGRKGSAGRVHWVETDYWPHDTTLWVREFRGNSRRYVYYKLLSMDLASFDTGSANPTVNRNIVHPVRVSWPPYDEQCKIAVRLNQESDRIDALVDRVRFAIERLKEFRTALISAAVTGKIDVREEAA